MTYSVQEIKKSYLNDKNILDRSFYNRDTSAVARELIGMLKPSREYFAKHKEYLEQLNVKDITR